MLLPFGLKIALAALQREMRAIFNHLPFVAVYLDDFLAISKTGAEHASHPERVLEGAERAQVFCQAEQMLVF